MSKANELLKLTELDFSHEIKRAVEKIKQFLDSFKNYGHYLEVLGNSDELMTIDDAREALKEIIKRGSK